MIYFDNAATTMKKPDCVVEAVCRAMCELGNSGRGVHAASLGAMRTIYGAREQAAALFGVSAPDRIAFTKNATEALNTAIKGLFLPGDHIITTVLEHNSVLRPLYELEKKGTELSFAGCDELGRLKTEEFEALLKPNTRAVVCTHASNVTGNVTDAEQIGKFCREHGLLFVLDASQTAGVWPVEMDRLQADVICFTGHKGLYGPQGTGGLCVREGIEIRPLCSGGSGVDSFHHAHPEQMPAHLEAGTQNGHGLAGLMAGIEFVRETGIEVIREHERKLADRFYRGICELPGIKIYGDVSGACHTAVVSWNFEDYSSGETADELMSVSGIASRSGAHCAPLMHKALGTEKQGAVRFSFSWFNTEEEVDYAIEAVKNLE